MVMQIRGGSLKVEIVDKIQFEVHSHFKTTFCPSNFGHTEQKQSGTFLSLCNLRNNISMAQSARHVISSNVRKKLSLKIKNKCIFFSDSGNVTGFKTNCCKFTKN